MRFDVGRISIMTFRRRLRIGEKYISNKKKR
jgi:hypothetical protein